MYKPLLDCIDNSILPATNKCINMKTIFLIITFSATALNIKGQEIRARELGILLDGTPGDLNAITDVRGVKDGQVTLISGQGKLIVGKRPVRTGVTAILPRGEKYDPVFAGWYTLNGNGVLWGQFFRRYFYCFLRCQFRSSTQRRRPECKNDHE
jgi:hypothetical protein